MTDPVRSAFWLSALVLFAGCASLEPTWKEAGSGEANLAFREQIEVSLVLDEPSLVEFTVEHRSGGLTTAYLTTGDACSFFRNRTVTVPPFFAGSLALVATKSVRSVVLPAGGQCFIAAPPPDGGSSFAYQVRVQPSRDTPATLRAAVPLDATARAALAEVTFRGEPWSPDWMNDSVHYYRAVGFFASYESDAAAVAGIVENLTTFHIRNETFHENLSELPETNADLWLLGADESRVWYEDLEQDVLPGEGKYEEMVWRLANMSRGNLAVTLVQETWGARRVPSRYERS